jgi:hypothetical protein
MAKIVATVIASTRRVDEGGGGDSETDSGEDTCDADTHDDNNDNNVDGSEDCNGGAVARDGSGAVN